MCIRAPFWNYDDLRARAEDFLGKHNPDRVIPVPIEQIVEAQFQMDIVPVPGLQQGFDTVSYLTADLQEIRVDEFVFTSRLNRYRFSLAHELGHRILHRDIFEQLAFDDIDSWKRMMRQRIPEKEYRFLEFHANSFAGLVLVPQQELAAAFAETIETFRGMGFSEFGDPVRDYVEASIAERFVVSPEVIHRRVERDDSWETVD